MPKTTLDKWSEASKECDKYNENMMHKYGTKHWDKVCTIKEWEEFLELCKKKHKLEKKLEADHEYQESGLGGE